MSEERIETAFKWGDRMTRILLGLIACAFALGGWVTALQFQVTSNAAAIARIEADRSLRIREYEITRAQTERAIVEMGTDLKWIRSAMEKR